MTNQILNNLVASGEIKSYKYVCVDDLGNEGLKGKFRNTERLILTFPSGKTLCLDTFCSGSSENTVLEISE